MQKNEYQSALIVTDPTHSRRVSQLFSFVSIPNDKDMTFTIVNSGVSWWDRETCYCCYNKRIRNLIKHEVIGIFYNFIAYSILYKVGLLDEFEDWIDN